MAEKVARTAKRTIVTQVMLKIKELIASGAYKASDRIPTESELAAMFGVGRSSVREAVKTFQYLGVLEPRVPKGTFVCGASKISSEAITWAMLLGKRSMRDIIEMREVIELRAVDALMSALGQGRESGRETVSRMEEAVSKMWEGADSGRAETLVDADYDFHFALVSAAENELFVSLLETLDSFLHVQIKRAYLAVPDLKEIAEDHQDLLAVLRAGDLDAAVARHRRHFDRTRRLLDESDRLVGSLRSDAPLDLER